MAKVTSIGVGECFEKREIHATWFCSKATITRLTLEYRVWRDLEHPLLE